ncbi:MAG: radical SAM protein [Peptococcaceae bacterium]|nr:radical SAM protein [Peptococcaceae bacterium]
MNTFRLRSLVRKAWQTRVDNFPPSIVITRPTATEAVSVTGDKCALSCAHCGGHFLKRMVPLEVSGIPNNPNVSSYLVSGGCNREGKVPFVKHLDLIKKLGRHKRLNFHTGLVTEKEAARLKDVADAVSFDFIADNETIREVLGLAKTVDDFIASYQALRKYVKVFPHICIGLKGGVTAGEYRALELLSELGADGLVFIVFMPVKGTRFAACRPPSLVDVVNILAAARIKFPDLPINLGCMRPGGRYRRKLDTWAVRCGINNIVMPAPQAVSEAKHREMDLVFNTECCVLW